MAKLARVLSSDVNTHNDIDVLDIKCDPTGGALVTAEHANPCGYEATPLPGDTALVSRVEGSGKYASFSYHSPLPIKALPGDTRVYARNKEGEQVSQLWMHNSGDVRIMNEKVDILVSASGSARVSNSIGSIELEESGDVVINGVTITVDGDVITPDGVSLRTHTHDQPADNKGVGQATTNPPNTR